MQMGAIGWAGYSVMCNSLEGLSRLERNETETQAIIERCEAQNKKWWPWIKNFGSPGECGLDVIGKASSVGVMAGAGVSSALSMAMPVIIAGGVYVTSSYVFSRRDAHKAVSEKSTLLINQASEIKNKVCLMYIQRWAEILDKFKSPQPNISLMLFALCTRGHDTEQIFSMAQDNALQDKLVDYLLKQIFLEFKKNINKTLSEPIYTEEEKHALDEAVLQLEMAVGKFQTDDKDLLKVFKTKIKSGSVGTTMTRDILTSIGQAAGGTASTLFHGAGSLVMRGAVKGAATATLGPLGAFVAGKNKGSKKRRGSKKRQGSKKRRGSK